MNLCSTLTPYHCPLTLCPPSLLTPQKQAHHFQPASVYSISLVFLPENRGKMSWHGAESQVSWSSASKPHFPPLISLSALRLQEPFCSLHHMCCSSWVRPPSLLFSLLLSCPPSLPLSPQHLENFYSTFCPLLNVTFSGTSSNPHLDPYICSFHIECLL